MGHIGVAVILLVALLTACSDSDEPTGLNAVHVKASGDSITLQSGNRLIDSGVLAPGSTMENRGHNGQRAQEMIDGTYGNLPEKNMDFVYTFSFGVNECMQGKSTSEYIGSMEDILTRYRGYLVVLEAPWRVTNPNCSDRIDDYREKLQLLGIKYNVSVVIEDSQETTESIHLTSKHMNDRARLLATTIKGLQ